MGVGDFFYLDVKPLINSCQGFLQGDFDDQILGKNVSACIGAPAMIFTGKGITHTKFKTNDNSDFAARRHRYWIKSVILQFSTISAQNL